MVICKLCGGEYIVITPLHLKKHNSTIAKYQKRFPKALIRNPYNCAVCEIEVTDGTSSKSKYCRPCATEINKQNVLQNVRKYNRNRKRQIQKGISEFNRSVGISFDHPNSMYRQTRIDSTHTGVDFIPGLLNSVGTVSKGDLSVNKDGRIKGAVRLENEIRKIKEGRGRGRRRR